MEHLETPAFLLFLHQLPLLLGLWALSSQQATSFDIGHVSSSDLQAAIPEAVLVSLQWMLFFASLNFGPALVVVAITATAGVLLPALFPVQILQAQGVPSLASLTSTQMVRVLEAAAPYAPHCTRRSRSAHSCTPPRSTAQPKSCVLAAHAAPPPCRQRWRWRQAAPCSSS